MGKQVGKLISMVPLGRVLGYFLEQNLSETTSSFWISSVKRRPSDLD